MSESGQRLDVQTAVTRGVIWNGVYQAFSVVTQFCVMLMLVRLVAPADYGKVGAVLGLLHLANAFGCATFMAQALQLPEGQEPDWTLHWYCGLWIQSGLAAACLALAAATLWLPGYADLAPLIAVAAGGLMLDAPSRLRAVQLQRALDFRRLRLAAMVSTLLSVVTSVSLAASGWGALALVLGGSVAPSLGFSLDLLLVARWRPSGPWVSWPSWTRYREALRFGAYQGAAGVLRSSKGMLATAILPATIGFEALGLLGRAEALFTSTIQRVSGLIGETVYPVLPQCAADQQRFHRVAGAFSAISFLILVPGCSFVVLEGPAISRLLYGQRWIDADPLLAPQTIAAALAGLALVAYRVLLARSLVRSCLLVDALSALLGGAAVLGTLWLPDAKAYAWWLAGGGAAVACITGILAHAGSPIGLLRALAPALVAAAVGSLALSWSRGALPGLPHLALAARALVFGLAAGVTLRLLFPSRCAVLLSVLPGGRKMLRYLLLKEEQVTC